MTLGEHTGLVEEVIDFAFSGRVLFASGPAEETASAWIIDNLQLALEINAGDGEASRFRIAPQQDVANWGNMALGKGDMPDCSMINPAYPVST